MVLLAWEDFSEGRTFQPGPEEKGGGKRGWGIVPILGAVRCVITESLLLRLLSWCPEHPAFFGLVCFLHCYFKIIIDLEVAQKKKKSVKRTRVSFLQLPS